MFNFWGLRVFFKWENTTFTEFCSVLLIGSKRFHWAYAQLLGCWRWSRHLSSIDCIVGPCDTLPLKNGRTLRLGAVNLFLICSGSEIPTITHVVPKTNVDIYTFLLEENGFHRFQSITRKKWLHRIQSSFLNFRKNSFRDILLSKQGGTKNPSFRGSNLTENAELLLNICLTFFRRWYVAILRFLVHLAALGVLGMIHDIYVNLGNVGSFGCFKTSRQKWTYYGPNQISDIQWACEIEGSRAPMIVFLCWSYS